MITPPYLKAGDTVALAAPARFATPELVSSSQSLLESWGLMVHIDPRLAEVENQFGGKDEVRAALLEDLLQNDAVQAIWFVRGGYGSVRLLEHLSGSYKTPKWLVGYSDITAIHAWAHRTLGWETLHAPMPIDIFKDTEGARLSAELLKSQLFGMDQHIHLPAHDLDREGDAQGILLGGNLSMLYSLLGSEDQPDTDGAILFIEDLDEYLYHIDRMMMALKRAGLLENLAALVIGGMNDMNDNSTPFGSDAETTIRRVVDTYSYPVRFGLPSGHVAPNYPLILGREYQLKGARLLPQARS